MALAQDLMGFGVSPQQANRTASGGAGPLTIQPLGSSYAGSAKLGATQFLCSVPATATLVTGTTSGVGLPTVGTDNGALLADQYIINNAGSATITVWASSGVSISVGASNTSSTAVAVHTSITCYPVSTVQWIGIKGS